MSITDDTTTSASDRIDAGAATDCIAEASGNRPGGVNQSGEPRAVPSPGSAQDIPPKILPENSGVRAGVGAKITGLDLAQDEGADWNAAFGAAKGRGATDVEAASEADATIVALRNAGENSQKNSELSGAPGSVDGVALSPVEAEQWRTSFAFARHRGDDPERAISHADGRVRYLRLVDGGPGAPLGRGMLLAVAAKLGLSPRDLGAGVGRYDVPPMPPNFAPDQVTLVLRSGASVVSFDVTKHQTGELSVIEVEEFNEMVRFVLWGMRNGMRLPDLAAVAKPGADLCPACGARPHNQDQRLAKPEIVGLVHSALSRP